MSEPARDDWDERAVLAEQTREAIEACGPMSMGEGFYLARRAEGWPDLESHYATRTRGEWPPRARVPRGPRLTAVQVLEMVMGGPSFK